MHKAFSSRAAFLLGVKLHVSAFGHVGLESWDWFHDETGRDSQRLWGEVGPVHWSNKADLWHVKNVSSYTSWWCKTSQHLLISANRLYSQDSLRSTFICLHANHLDFVVYSEIRRGLSYAACSQRFVPRDAKRRNINNMVVYAWYLTSKASIHGQRHKAHIAYTRSTYTILKGDLIASKRKVVPPQPEPYGCNHRSRGSDLHYQHECTWRSRWKGIWHFSWCRLVYRTMRWSQQWRL